MFGIATKRLPSRPMNNMKREINNVRKSGKLAKKARDSGSVVILVDENVPIGAISLLGKV